MQENDAESVAIIGEKMKKNITRLMELFVEKRYSEIAGWSKNIRLTADEIKEAIDDYGRGQKVVSPPPDFLNHVDFMQIADADDGRKQWYVVFDLWMDKDGKSDLSVELTFIDSPEECYDIEVDNIHMM